MANLAAVKAEVLRIVEDHITPLTNAITTHVQRAQKTIEDRCAFLVQEETKTYALAPAGSFLGYPTNFITDRGDPYYIASATSDYVTHLEEIADPMTESITATGPPKYWTKQQGGGIEGLLVLPKSDGLGPNVGGSYGIVIPYYKRLDTLINDADSNYWSDNYDDILAWKAAANVYAEMRDPMAQFWNGVAMARFMEVLKTTKRNKLRKSGTSVYPTQSLSGNQRKRYKRIIVAQVP